MWSTVRDRLMDRLRDDPAVRAAIPQLEAEVRAGALTATLAADTVLAHLGLVFPDERHSRRMGSDESAVRQNG
jgi:LAO/AO transport system kinase